MGRQSVLGQLEQGMGVPFFLYHQRKEDRNPYVWGRFSLQQIREEARASTRKRVFFQSLKKQPLKIDVILSRLRTHSYWTDVLSDSELKKNLWKKYNVMKQLWYDKKSLRNMETRLMEEIANYLWARNAWKDPLYSPENLGEKDLILDWLAINRSVRLSFPIKTRQLFIYGEPSTQKRLFITMLEKAGIQDRRKKGLLLILGANDFFDLWVLDEFQDQSAEQSQSPYDQKTGAYLNHLLKLLDGQKCRLDAKYERL